MRLLHKSMNKYLTTIELDKVLAMLSSLASNGATRQLALEIEPDSDLERVRYECGKTNRALSLSIQYGTPSFVNFKDVSTSVNRAKSGAVISLRDLLDIAVMLRQIKSLADWHSHFANTETELTYLFSRLMPNDWLLEKLERSILSETEIADGASTELSNIRRKISRSRLKLRENLDRMMKNTGVQKCLQDSIVTIRDGRYVLPVKAEHRGDVAGLIHDVSGSGQTIFIEPISVVEANNDIRMLEIMELEEIERIIRELCSDCGSYAEILCDNYKICAELNLYFAKSELAAKMNATMPNITADGVIKLRKARHPLIAKDKVVPINLHIGEQYQSMIITGPNTGGKTVALKTAGLLSAMTMCGLLIPVSDGSSISVFDKILADIGDSQSIEHNLSTFSSHTNKVIEILETADERSLVLLDELGSGTDPIEGAALAVSIIEDIMSSGAKLMVTTHYQELKIFAVDHPNVENASCEFDIETLRPTYRLIAGSPGKSNAFAISESLGMPKHVIEKAKSLLSTENSRFEEVVEKLEQRAAELQNQLDEARRLKNEAEQNALKLRHEIETLEKTKAEELEKARVRAMGIIEATKIESNELLDELEKLRREKDRKDFSQNVSDVKQKSNRSFNAMYDIANPVEKKNDNNDGYVLPRNLKKGDTVKIMGLKKEGVVVSEPGGNSVLVQIGMMKSKFDIAKLRLVENTSQKPQTRKTGAVGAKADRRGTLELDIRGMACDEGVYELDAFIDQAVLSNISVVTVIHGKGTGLLRNAVHRRLKAHPAIKSFRLGLFGEGEDGVTIAELK